MDEKKLYWDTVKYTLLYGVAVVPLGLFLGVGTCAGVLMGVGFINSTPTIVLSMGAFAIVFGGSFYLSYKLGREKAEKNAAAASADTGKEVPPGGAI